MEVKESHPKSPPSGLNLHTDTVLPFLRSNALRRCLESLSQKWKFPSEPAVAKVPYLWKAIEFTEYTAACVPFFVFSDGRITTKISTLIFHPERGESPATTVRGRAILCFDCLPRGFQCLLPMGVRCRGQQNIGWPSYRDPVALEGETELGGPVGGNRLVTPRRCLRFGGLLAEVLDAHATLDRPDSEPLLVWEDGHASG